MDWIERAAEEIAESGVAIMSSRARQIKRIAEIIRKHDDARHQATMRKMSMRPSDEPIDNIGDPGIDE